MVDFEITNISDIHDNYPQKRDCLSSLLDYLKAENNSKVCILYGLRRTGKTVLLKQALLSLDTKEKKKAVFITCNHNTDFYNILSYIKDSIKAGKKYYFIDEITYAKNFQNLAEILSDSFVANYNAKIILTGTDSLGLALPSHYNLYDRAIFIHTTYTSFAEFSRIMNNNSTDFYIKHGNTLSPNSPFSSFKATCEYIETSIVSNIISSLEKSEGIRSYPPSLTELYDNRELDNAIQRIINQYSQTITIRALRKQFELSPLENAINALTKRSDNPDLTLRANIAVEKITSNVKELLKIDDFKTSITKQHLNELKDFLLEMDVIINIPVVTSYVDNTKDVDMELITHPGMYHANLLYTIEQLELDDNWLPNATKEQKDSLLNAVYECASGKILENVVITDIYKMLSESSSKWYVSKFNHTIKGKFEEVDLIILNKQTKDVFLFEIKHSSKIDDRQTKHLESEQFISYIQDNFGPVKERIVLYNGVTNRNERLKRINIADFLTHMYKNYRNPEYSIDNSINPKLETKTITKKKSLGRER